MDIAKFVKDLGGPNGFVGKFISYLQLNNKLGNYVIYIY